MKVSARSGATANAPALVAGSPRSLEAWLAQLSAREDRRAAAEALHARLVEKVNEVELGGRREAA